MIVTMSETRGLKENEAKILREEVEREKWVAALDGTVK
jgi:hypothetical protein